MGLDFKRSVLLAFLAHFEREIAALVGSAKSAHEAATHEESRAEDRHDTFAIEASYLAQGQAIRVQTLRKSMVELTGLLDHLNGNLNSVDVGALITLESNGKRTHSFIAEFGGGVQVTLDQKTISLMSPSSPMGEGLIGLTLGDTFTLESKNGDRDFKIVEIT